MDDQLKAAAQRALNEDFFFGLVAGIQWELEKLLQSRNPSHIRHGISLYVAIRKEMAKPEFIRQSKGKRFDRLMELCEQYQPTRQAGSVRPAAKRARATPNQAKPRHPDRRAHGTQRRQAR